MINNENDICKECNEYKIQTKSSLGWHIKNCHKDLTYADYIIKHEHNGINPICANTSCGKKLHHSKGGFRKYCSKSCASSGINNPMHGKKGKLSPNKGKQRTEEQKENYRHAANKRWNPEEYKKFEEKLVETKKTNNQLTNRKSDKILQISLEDGNVINTWNFASEPGKELGYNSDRILKVAKGTAKKSNGFFWCYENKELQNKHNVFPKDFINKIHKTKSNKTETERNAVKMTKTQNNSKRELDRNKVLQIDLQTGAIIATFDSPHRASEAINHSCKSIKSVLNGKSPKSGGFFWCYEDPELQKQYNVFPNNYKK